MSDISALSGLMNLRKLFLKENQISNIEPLQSLTNLIELVLEKNQISDFSILSKLVNLTVLNLEFTSLKNISFLSNLTNLEKLDLEGNQISDISPIKNLKKLTKLDLRNNPIKELPEWVLNIQDLEIIWDNIPNKNKQIKLLTSLPAAPDLCIGRDEKLKEIHEKLKQRQSIALLNGVGGIGKTTLALEFVHTETYIQAFDYVAWISLITYSLHEALIQGLHGYFGIDLKQFPDPNDQLNQIAMKMKSLAGNNLLVIDNANNAKELTENEGFLKSLGFKLLITSRAVPDNFVQIDVNELEMNDAKALFIYHYPDSKTMEGLPELLQHINKHTLLTELSAKIGKKILLTPHQILERLSQTDTKHPDLNRYITVGLHADMTDKQKETKLNSYIEALFEPENESAENQAFLKQFALFANTDVAVKHLNRMWNIASDNENDFEDFLEQLIIGGWLNKKATKYRIHPLVAQVIRQKLKPTPDSTEELIETLENILANEHLSTQSLYVPYAQNVVDIFKAEKNSWLGRLCFALSRTYRTFGQLTPALQTIETAETIFEGIDKDRQSVCIQDIATIQMLLGKTMVALENYEKFNKIKIELIKEEPDNERHKIGLAVSIQMLGRVYYDMGKLDNALDNFMEMNRLSKELYEYNPQNESIKFGLAVSYEKLGDVYLLLGKLDLALENYTNSLSLIKELYKHNPQNESLKNGLAISYSKLGEVYSALGKLDLVLENYLERNRLSEELYKHNPQNENFKNGLAVSYSKLGEVFEALGNFDLALENYLKGNRLGKELYEHNPQNESLKNGLAISYSKLGDVYIEYGNLDLSLEFYLKSNELSIQLFEHNPQNIELFYGLGASQLKLGVTYKKIKRQELANLNFQKALKIFRELVNSYKRKRVEEDIKLIQSYLKSYSKTEIKKLVVNFEIERAIEILEDAIEPDNILISISSQLRDIKRGKLNSTKKSLETSKIVQKLLNYIESLPDNLFSVNEDFVCQKFYVPLMNYVKIESILSNLPATMRSNFDFDDNEIKINDKRIARRVYELDTKQYKICQSITKTKDKQEQNKLLEQARQMLLEILQIAYNFHKRNEITDEEPWIIEAKKTIKEILSSNFKWDYSNKKVELVSDSKKNKVFNSLKELQEYIYEEADNAANAEMPGDDEYREMAEEQLDIETWISEELDNNYNFYQNLVEMGWDKDL